jgi:hypothetical protein
MDLRISWIVQIALIFCVMGPICGQSSDIPPQKLVERTTYGAGFFAEMQKVLDSLLHYSQENLRAVHVDWTDEFFPYKEDPHANGWDLYFEPIQIPSAYPIPEEDFVLVGGLYYHEIHDFPCIDQWKNYDRYLPYRLAVNAILNKYIKIKEPITTKANQFVSEKMSGHYCIGVHIRYGSDHGAEAPAGVPTLEDYIEEVSRVVAAHHGKRVRIYLATDSHYVIKKFQRLFPQEMLLSIDAYRTEYRDVPHLIYGNGDYWLAHKEEFHRKKPGYSGGEGVLLDALLLGHCDILVHSSSNIASFVSFYNPYIQSIYLPKSSKTWPCRFGKTP